MVEKMNPVCWFEIPVSNLRRARAFYEHLLGVELELHTMGALEMARFPAGKVPGASGALVKAASYTPSSAGSMVYFSVDDVNAALGRAVEQGAKVLNPRMSIGEYGFVAHLEDTEGNRIAIHALQ